MQSHETVALLRHLVERRYHGEC